MHIQRNIEVLDSHKSLLLKTAVSIGITWELVRNAEARASPRPAESEAAFYQDPPGNVHTHESLRSTVLNVGSLGYSC